MKLKAKNIQPKSTQLYFLDFQEHLLLKNSSVALIMAISGCFIRRGGKFGFLSPQLLDCSGHGSRRCQGRDCSEHVQGIVPAQ